MYNAELFLYSICHAEQYVHSRKLHSRVQKAISYLIFRYRPLDWTGELILSGPSRKILCPTTHEVKELASKSARGNRGHVS